MKKTRKVIRILAIVTLPLLLFLWILTYCFVETFPPGMFERERFTKREQATICDMLQLELAPGESISIFYQPDQGYFNVSVHDVVSVESFLSRLHAEKELQDDSMYRKYSLSGGAYDFLKYSDLILFEDNRALFVTGGFMSTPTPELVNVENVLCKYKALHAVSSLIADLSGWLVYATFWGGIALELGFITTLIILRRKAKKEKPSCQVNPS